MKTSRHLSLRHTTWTVCLLAFALLGVVTRPLVAASDESKVQQNKAAIPTTITTGSGAKFKTTVEQKPGGELSPEDFRQTSLLASRIVMHLNDAVAAINVERLTDAHGEIEKGLSLIKVVRELLPTTEVTTVVRDSNGSEVYRYVDQVQDNRIPLYAGLVAVKVVEPITDAKREAAEVAGVQLADAKLIHTSALLELDYVEAKLKNALKNLPDKPSDALEQLALAQSHGVTFTVNRQDDPLVAAQMALQLAEQMVEQNRIDAAKANLQHAKNQLVLYRSLIGEDEGDDVKKLEADITGLQANIERAGAVAEIRGFWDRVVNWFSRERQETRADSSK